jgi:hypothetical protein
MTVRYSNVRGEFDVEPIAALWGKAKTLVTRARLRKLEIIVELFDLTTRTQTWFLYRSTSN